MGTRVDPIVLGEGGIQVVCFVLCPPRFFWLGTHYPQEKIQRGCATSHSILPNGYRASQDWLPARTSEFDEFR